jgi:hypothetical protein
MLLDNIPYNVDRDQIDLFHGKAPGLLGHDREFLIPIDSCNDEEIVHQIRLKYGGTRRKLTQEEYHKFLVSSGFNLTCDILLDKNKKDEFVLNFTNFKLDKEMLHNHIGHVYYMYNLTRKIFKKLGEGRNGFTFNQNGTFAKGRKGGMGRTNSYNGVPVSTALPGDKNLIGSMIEDIKNGEVYKLYSLQCPNTVVIDPIFGTEDIVSNHFKMEQRIIKIHNLATRTVIENTKNGH